MNEQLMQQVQQMIQQGASKGDVAQQLMAAVQEGQLDQESVMQVFQQLGITEQDLQQPQQPSDAQQQVMALGGMRRYPDGGQPSPEEMAMMEQQAQQQQGAPQEGQPQGGGDQMQQVMQQVQQMIEQGAQPVDVVQALLQNQIPPEAIMQILTEMGMPPQEAQGLIQQVMQGGQQQPQGPGEEQMEGAASNPQEEAQEMPMQNYGGYVKEVMRKALGGNVTSDVDSGNVAAKRNLEFASVLKRNTHRSMLDNAFNNGVEDKQNNLPRADNGFQTSFKALMEQYKDDADAKAYLEATKGLREDSEYMANLKTLRETYKDNPELLKTLDQVEKQYKAAKEMQALQQQFSGAYGPGQYYQGPGQYYNNPSAFSRLINNSGWDRSRPNFDISGIPLSNDPNAKYYITNKTDKQGMFGRRKVSFDVDWNRGDVAGADPNKTVVDPNKTVTLTPGQQRRANRRLGNNFEDALETATDPIYNDKTLSEVDRLTENYSTAFDVISGNKDYKNQTNPYLGTYLDPAKTLGEDESEISRRDIKNYYEDSFPNLPGRDRRRLARESYRTGEIITGGMNRPADASGRYTFRKPEDITTDKTIDVNSNVPLNDNGDPLVDEKGALISYDYTTEEPSRRDLRRAKRDEKKSLELEEDLKKQDEEKKQQVSEKYRENFDNSLDESFSAIDDQLTDAQKLKVKREKFNDLKSKVGNYNDYENIYEGTYLDPSGINKDSSRGDIKDYYREAFPELSRRDTRRLAREADKSGKILEGGLDGKFRTFKTTKLDVIPETKSENDFNLKQAFGNFANKVGGWFSKDANTEQKAYGGNMWMPRADGGLQMYLKSLGLDEKDANRLNKKASDADSGSGTFAVKDRFKLDWDAATDTTKDAMDWVSSKFDNLDVQERMDNPDRFSSINQFAPQNYEQMSRGLYGQQGEFIPNDQGPTTIFNPTDAEGTFYRQLYALGGNVTIDSFTEEELQILKDAGYNIDDLI